MQSFLELPELHVVCVHHGVVEKQVTSSLACHHGLSSCLKGAEQFKFFSLLLAVLL